MSDRYLTCRDCGSAFAFTDSEQAFFASKGYTNEPSRCPECRESRKRSQGSGSGGGYYSQNFQSRERQMYSATCGRCGKATKVPFQPRNDRPVYCQECFRRSGQGAASGR
jgi:CxxC-x17-CxxC domain-containing protein